MQGCILGEGEKSIVRKRQSAKHKSKLIAQLGRGQSAKHKSKLIAQLGRGQAIQTRLLANTNLSAPPQFRAPTDVPCHALILISGLDPAGARSGSCWFCYLWVPACPLPDCASNSVCVDTACPLPNCPFPVTADGRHVQFEVIVLTLGSDRSRIASPV